MENIIVFLIICVAFLYLAKRFYKKAKKDSGCQCTGCDTCDSSHLECDAPKDAENQQPNQTTGKIS
jgi:hypothetical protein